MGRNVCNVSKQGICDRHVSARARIWERGEGYTQCYGHDEEPLLGGSVLRTLINLFPQREVIVHAAVKVRVKGDPSDVVKHEIWELQQVAD